MLRPLPAADVLARLDQFSAVIDARSPAEYALDHLPGALNWPSLDDAERAEIGTLYVQVSPFEARKRGALLVARNIARHVEREVLDKPRDWKPLVYCWRGGQRSGSLGLVLGQIGFGVGLLEGGYQQYRRAVLAALDAVPSTLDLRVVVGPTGSGKSRLLAELAAQGAQVLDLEGLAEHRGSVLGLLPGTRQPGQKAFETRLWDALRRLDPSRPVYVESESRKIGDLRLPTALVERMRGAACLSLALPTPRRVALLIEEYAPFVADPAALCARLDALKERRGRAQVEAWQALSRAGQVTELVTALLEQHYDPLYAQSMAKHFAHLRSPRADLSWDGDAASLAAAARAAIEVG